jgi:phosphoglucosamine mutase
MKRLFGTDGIRGIAGEPPLDAVTVSRFGAALAVVLGRAGGGRVRVVLGRDTRDSGAWLRDAVASGLCRHGAGVIDAGVITTPGLALVTRAGGFDAGVMISASHNPYHDNGLKVFGAEGTKLPDELEAEIEARILDRRTEEPVETAVAIELDPSLLRRYIAFLHGVVRGPSPLSGLKLCLDCANGSASGIAPEVFRFHGASVEAFAAEPDGRNINLDCGSLHLGRLASRVREGRFDLGLAFDGDADRALAVDRRGRTVDGDTILYLAARRLRRRGELQGDAVVATIMSNLWLEHRLREEGMRLVRAPVGDKYVLERMLAEGATLGGEQSGHVIFRHLAPTGDGILTGLILLVALREEARRLEEILDGIVPCPQVLLNVPVREKPDLRRHPGIGPVVAAVEAALRGRGRVVLRYSGTEPLARVMVEGTDAAEVHAHAERLAEAIRRQLGR